MLRCNEVTRLCASEEIREASLWTRASVRLHLLMCRHCRRYVRELRAMAQAVRDLARIADDAPAAADAAEGGDANERLIARMLEETKRPEG